MDDDKSYYAQCKLFNEVAEVIYEQFFTKKTKKVNIEDDDSDGE